jgi:anti-sigma factor RsiW
MTHEIQNIQAWLSGELSTESAALLEKHLKQCPDCARAAREASKVWDLLGGLEPAASAAGPSVWPAVRQRTLGKDETGAWFFGTGRVVRSSLATAAVAAGLLMGFLLPGADTSQVGGQAEALAVSEDQVELAWLIDSSWGTGLTDFESSWLTAGQDQGSDLDTTEPGGSR